MNKFYEIKEGSIREDLNFIKKLNLNNRGLEESQLWTKLCMHQHPHPKKDEVEDEDDDKEDEPCKRFSTHPKRLFSDTDTSMMGNSPRRLNLSSSDSNIHLEHEEEFVYEYYGESKVEIKNTRKKLHKKLTQTKEDTSYHFETGIGDSSSVSPRSVRGKRSVIFEDEKSRQNEPVKPAKVKQKQKGIVTIPGKKTLPSKSPSLYKNIISDSVFEKKFKIFVEKSLHTITEIRAFLENGDVLPDGDEDMSRRIIRVKEFSNRFSRNCLYPLARQLEDLNKMNPDDANINQKLLSSYQVILNGLQSYLNHLPTSIGSCASDKLKSLLKHLLDLCTIHSKSIKEPDENGCSDFIETFKLNAELTMQKIEELFCTISTDSILKSTATKVSLHQSAPSKPIIRGGPRKNKIEKRLSMYSVSAAFRRDANWRKAVESLAKKKLNVNSRYKTSTFRHRQPPEKELPMLSFPSRCKLFCKKSSDMLKKTPVTTPVNEDSITTMVQMEDEREKGDKEDICDGKTDCKEPLNHEEVVVKLLQLVLDNNQRKSVAEAADNDEPTAADKQIADILDRLKSEGNADTLQKILDGLQRKEPPQELRLEVVASQSSLEEGAAKKRKEPVVTVTGEKNAKLICIKDDNSIVESERNPTPPPAPPPTAEHKEGQVKDTCTKPDVKLKEKTSKNVHKSTKTTVKMNRLPKSSKVLQMLPKNYAVSIIQYKLDFHKSCKSNPMYRKTTNLEPWMLMARISDKILNHALLTVASEIEVNDVVQKIYESELQL